MSKYSTLIFFILVSSRFFPRRSRAIPTNIGIEESSQFCPRFLRTCYRSRPILYGLI